MKKLLFTALAVVAFSGVSMAKTEEVLVFKDCDKQATDKTNKDESARDNNGRGCYSSDTYNKIRKLYYIECKLEIQKMEEPAPFLHALEDERFIE